MKTFSIIITGIVQGVGFRPFIYNLARKSGINGEVSNTTEGVYIKANFSTLDYLMDFLKKIRMKKPRSSIIENIEYHEVTYSYYEDFQIKASKKSKERFQLISPDIATCRQCQADISNKKDPRRYNYPFTNCTNCGPRFTIIKSLPYDRPNTTMSEFNMCKDCLREYNDSYDRRFHAQPNACRNCGPKLLLVDSKGLIVDKENPLKAACNEIRKGKIIGIKSLGGFQIACDALSTLAIDVLRERKKRPFKPFALMFKDIDIVKEYFFLSEIEKNILLSPASPIVLLKKKKILKEEIPELSKSISFDNKFEGIMLPYTPLHHLLLSINKTPLVMTSGNLSEEPITSDNETAIQKLNHICDYFLIHDRPIYSKYDDSLVVAANNEIMVLRRARGYAPYPVKLKEDADKKTIISLGAQEKNTFCILKNKYAILSQHLGDMDKLESNVFFKDTLGIYNNLFNIKNYDIICVDKHPNYFSSRYGKEILEKENKKSKVICIQHHKAHAASVIAENHLLGKKIAAFSWDGTGYGDDGKIWGSEIFFINEKMLFKRVGHLTEKILPGGEVSINRPYRMALTYIYNSWNETNKTPEIFEHYLREKFPHFNFIKEEELKIILFQINNNFNSIITTSMGRFFDAVSSILDIKHFSSYEGEAAVCLEMYIARNSSHSYQVDTLIQFDNKTGEALIDDMKFFSLIVKDFISGKKSSFIALKFHNTLANIILEISKWMRYFYKTEIITLSGGVFQNIFLIEKVFRLLTINGFKTFTNLQVPVNDGGISLGQAFIALNKIK
ncbi:MAG: carbamoyltransferase HypF [Actinomycetota bacterium]|nr:carbamoyltransferase HypF [Actinomycetota bacterium]